MQAEWEKITIHGDTVRSTSGTIEKVVSRKLCKFPKIPQKCDLLLEITTIICVCFLQTSWE